MSEPISQEVARKALEACHILSLWCSAVDSRDSDVPDHEDAVIAAREALRLHAEEQKPQDPAEVAALTIHAWMHKLHMDHTYAGLPKILNCIRAAYAEHDREQREAVRRYGSHKLMAHPHCIPCEEGVAELRRVFHLEDE